MRPFASTYRLQLHGGFSLAAARELADYLDDLGVGAVYVSPILKAARGSTHGYDLVDPTEIDPALGGEAAFVAWADDLAKRAIGRVVDFVPNHVGIGTGENVWWNDVLENGRWSLFADFFDIEWDPPQRTLHGKVLLPILDKPYAQALEQGELRLRRVGPKFYVDHLGRPLPVALSSLSALLRGAARAGTAEPRSGELVEIAASLESLPAVSEPDDARRAVRAWAMDLIERRLEKLLAEATAVARAVDDAVGRLEGRAEDRSTFDGLDQLLQAQSYRLSDWRVGPDEINYRRFVDIASLAAVRMENPAVFAAMHGLVLRLVGAGRIDGLRLDHTDGLREPTTYFANLRRALAEARGPAEPQTYVVAEKILAEGESLPRSWRIDGTTGYDFLGQVTAVWMDPAGEAALTEIHRTQTRCSDSYETVAVRAKREVMSTILSSEVHLLAADLEGLARGRRRSRDFTRRLLNRALGETLAALGVYRTYVRPDGGKETDDEEHMMRATARARRHHPDLAAVLDFVLDMVLLRASEDLPAEQRAGQVRFAMRFQELAGSVMAKGVEDTAFYRYTRLIALNEVGARPEELGAPLSAFHAANVRRRELWRESMLATSTHDTKRAEDARARLAVLSEIPAVWRARVAEWNVLATAHQTTTGAASAPTPQDRYYFYQAVVAALPFEDLLRVSDEFVRRTCEHMAKATKEAKRETSWSRPDEAYDAAVRRFVTGMLRDPVYSACLREFVHAIGAAGASNALGQLMLKLTCPGVADVYQGSELWSFDFCDPDNRRPVDYALRRRRLAALRETPTTPSLAAELLRTFQDGRVKMHVCRTLLRLRREHPRLFVEGFYRAIDAGERAVAFSREGDGHRLVAVCARRVTKMTHGATRWATGHAWGDAVITVPRGAFVDVLTGRTLESRGQLALRDVCEVLPLAVLFA